MSRSPHFKSLVFLCILASTPAFAQDDPELGETSPGAAGASGRKRSGNRRGAPEPAPAAPVAEEPPEAPPAFDASASTNNGLDADWERPKGESESEKKGDSDHEAVVGSIGIGLLGLAEIPVGVADPIGGGSARRTASSPMTAPVLGFRYWFGPRIGIEAGVGFSFSGGVIKVTNLPDADNATTRAYAFHGGLPLSLTFGKHYNLLAVPYFGVGISSATDTRGTTGSADDIFGKGMLVEGGLKMGVEVQLGGIGLEGLALQLTGGVRVRYESTSADVPVLNNMGAATGSVDIETTNVIVATSPGSSLGSALAGTLAAIYYF